MIAVLILVALAAVAAGSVVLVVRDVRRMHRRGRTLSDAPVSAGGVSDAGMAFIGTNGTH